LPLQKLQIQVTQVQEQLASEKERYTGIEMQLSALGTSQSVLQTKFDEHLKNK
jgi:hypothetical protein